MLDTPPTIDRTPAPLPSRITAFAAIIFLLESLWLSFVASLSGPLTWIRLALYGMSALALLTAGLLVFFPARRRWAAAVAALFAILGILALVLMPKSDSALGITLLPVLPAIIVLFAGDAKQSDLVPEQRPSLTLLWVGYLLLLCISLTIIFALGWYFTTSWSALQHTPFWLVLTVAPIAVMLSIIVKAWQFQEAGRRYLVAFPLALLWFSLFFVICIPLCFVVPALFTMLADAIGLVELLLLATCMFIPGVILFLLTIPFWFKLLRQLFSA